MVTDNFRQPLGQDTPLGVVCLSVMGTECRRGQVSDTFERERGQVTDKSRAQTRTSCGQVPEPKTTRSRTGFGQVPDKFADKAGVRAPLQATVRTRFGQL